MFVMIRRKKRGEMENAEGKRERREREKEGKRERATRRRGDASRNGREDEREKGRG